PLLDTIKVDEQNVHPVLGSYMLKKGVDYTVEISGTSVFSNGENLDAIYCLGGGGSTGCPARGASSVLLTIDGMPYFYPPDAFQQQYNSPDPNCHEAECPGGLAYQSSHVYTMTFWAPQTGVMKVYDYAAALGYTHNSPETGTYTIKILAVPATVTLPKDIRSPDSPTAMKDRIPPRVDTMIQVTVTGVSTNSPVTLEAIGGLAVTFNGSPIYDIMADGTYYPMLSAKAQTPCNAGRDVRIEALQGGQILAKTAPFAVSAIPYNYTETFHSEIVGHARGIAVQDGWSSDSGRISDLNCAEMAEVVQLIQGEGHTTTSSFLPADSFTVDTHSTGLNLIYPNMENITDQATVFTDGRSRSQDIPMQNSGYEIIRSADSTGLRFTTCKMGMAVSVTETKAGTHKKLTVSSKAGATTPKRGICRTQDVPEAQPAFVTASHTTCQVGHACDFQIVMDGRPQPKLTIAGQRPAGVHITGADNDTAIISGTPAKGSQGRYHMTFTAKNGVGREAVQRFTLYVDP
ncbi:MAG TPA: hypothetical protein VG815_15495, partial [Chloroflexota bacterium]|nr:hypothetical protein [Chloroflexota bacterium]